MRVILDRGHGQKAEGASFDPGVTHQTVKEVDLTAAYIQHAVRALQPLGHEVYVIDSGTYDARHARAIALAAEAPAVASIYVQCHINGGGGAYGAVEYDARSAQGRVAADFLAEALKGLPEIPRVKVIPLHAADRGWVCIDDIYASKTMCGALFEPFFIDSTAHAPLQTPAGLARVGQALANGIEQYAKASTSSTTA